MPRTRYSTDKTIKEPIILRDHFISTKTLWKKRPEFLKTEHIAEQFKELINLRLKSKEKKKESIYRED
ncbi:MAG: hypothetical protein BAJALOKI1v1_1780009 [Promethearchaeota archaeon]|nr:MAG: hypothetical protein BAJALOKI1v1_1780009 [Candidatus Lokiarchaeota archaeon]